MTEAKHVDFKEIQIVFFVSNNDLSNKLDVANRISEGFKEAVELTPTILPIPDDAPPEFPRIMFQNKDNSVSCNISLNRIDLTLKIARSSQGNKEDTETLVKENSNFLMSIVTKSLKWNVLRLALVIRVRIATADGAANFMRKFVSEPVGKNFLDLQIHRLTHEKVATFESNYWLRLISQSKDPEGESVVVISDINTVQNLENIDDKLMIKFFESALSESTDTISKLV